MKTKKVSSDISLFYFFFKGKICKEYMDFSMS